MFKGKQILKVVVIMAMVSTLDLFLGCNSSPVEEHGTLKSLKNNIIPTKIENKKQEQYISNEGLFEFNSSIQTNNLIDSVQQYQTVKSQIAYWKSKGYGYDPNYSFIMRSKVYVENVEDSLLGEVVVLTMRYLPNDTQKVVYVSYSRCLDSLELGYVVQSQLVSFINPEGQYFDSFEQTFDNRTTLDIWIRGFVPVFSLKEKLPMATTWNWKSWGKCTAAGAAGGCAAAATGCALTGPGWGACTAIGCGAATVGAAVGCAVSQLF